MNPSVPRSTRIAAAALATVLVLGLAGASVTFASGPDSVPEDLGHFRIARLQYSGGGDWYANPSSLPNLQSELNRRTGIPTVDREIAVTLDDERLFNYPMLYVTGHGTIRPSPGDLRRLRRYLDAGGFLWVDDNYGLDESFRLLAAELYPDKPLIPLGGDHPIYRAYYDLPGLPKIHEHDGLPAQSFGIFDNGRMAVFYTWSSDIGDGLEDPSVHNDAPEAREVAMRMAVNVCVFAMTQP